MLAAVVGGLVATWFGSETVLGIPAKFVAGGLNSVVEDPFGAGTCLILVGLFFAGAAVLAVVVMVLALVLHHIHLSNLFR